MQTIGRIDKINEISYLAKTNKLMFVFLYKIFGRLSMAVALSLKLRLYICQAVIVKHQSTRMVLYLCACSIDNVFQYEKLKIGEITALRHHVY